MQVHKNIIWKKFIIISAISFCIMGGLKAAQPTCSNLELANFKKLYIELQKQLNYEGKDAYIDQNGIVKLKSHTGKEYEGKVFEEALFKEYQNTLKKVGKIYQANLASDSQVTTSNPLLVNFMKAIENENAVTQDFISKIKIKEVIEELAKESEKKFNSGSDKKFILNAGDKYLLEKLLTHAQDRLCTVNQFDKDGKPTRIFKDVNYLKKIQNAPLNRLIQSIKNAKISRDSKIDLSNPSLDLVDPDVATKSAITEHMNNLANWVKNNKHCESKIRSSTFMNSIQANIQACNYSLMLDTLNKDNTSNLEAVLHFINANERLLNRGQAKAETALDEIKLEGFISTAFDNLGTMVRCTQISKPGDEDDKKIFIRNLPYDQTKNTFDKSSIICTQNSKELPNNECIKKFDLYSDGLGRGLELKPKEGARNFQFSIKNSPDCDNITPKSSPRDAILTDEDCRKQGDKTPDGPILTLDPDLKQCIPLTDNICSSRGLKLQPPKYLVFDKDEKKCVENSQAICEKRGKEKSPKESWYYDTTENSCKKISNEHCATLKDSDGKPMILSNDGLSCVSAPKEAKEPKLEALDDNKCKAKDPKSYYDEVSKTCKPYDQAYCDSKSTDGKKMVLKNDGTGCEEAKPIVDPYAKEKTDCDERQKDFIKSQGGMPSTKYKWNPKTNGCDDLKPDPKEEGSEDNEEEVYYDFKIPKFQNNPPPRFIPKALLPAKMNIERGMP